MKVKDVLSQGENLEYTTRSSFAPFFVPLGVTLAFTVFGAIVVSTNSYNSGIFALGVISIIAAVATGLFALTKLEYILTTKLYITSKRIIVNSGLLKSVHSEIPAEKISGVTIVEPLFGKLFGYGTIIVESSANVSGARALYVANPYEVKKMLDSKQNV